MILSMGQAWFRNPFTYIRECVEVLATNIAWDRGFAHKNRVDPRTHIEAHLLPSIPYRLLLVGDQGTAEYRRGSTEPVALYPVWEYGLDPLEYLEKLLADPTCFRSHRLAERGMAENQEHRVVITNLPGVNSIVGQGVIRMLQEMQSDYPEAIMHIHGIYSYNVAFGKRFGAADVLPRDWAAQGYLILPNGKRIRGEEEFEKNMKWVNMLGFRASELKVARNRCMFNIKSAIWAAENWDNPDPQRIRSSRKIIVDPDSIAFKPVTVQRRMIPQAREDRILCDQCDVASNCRLYRSQGVCVVPGSDTEELVKLMKSRDSDAIIRGLAGILEMELDAVDNARAVESDSGELQPELNRRLKTAFASGVQLAKLVNPTLAAAGATRVNVNVGSGGQAAILTTTPAQMISVIVAQLEAKGIHRNDITEEDVAAHLVEMARQGNQNAIEATST